MTYEEQEKETLEIEKLKLEIKNMPYVAKTYNIKIISLVIAALAVGKFFL